MTIYNHFRWFPRSRTVCVSYDARLLKYNNIGISVQDTVAQRILGDKFCPGIPLRVCRCISQRNTTEIYYRIYVEVALGILSSTCDHKNTRNYL